MMYKDVDFVPIADPLLRRPRLEHTGEIPVLGIRTQFATNSRHVLRTVEEFFGGWHVADSLAPRSEPMRIRIIVHAGDEGDARPIPVRHIAPDDTRVIVQTPGSIAISDPDRRESIAYVTATLAAEREVFRESVLEAVTLALLCDFDRHPVHAAAVGRGGRSVLLFGASGSGKSTLAHLAHAAGMDVMSEDRVWIQLTPSLRLWGWPGHARLLTGDGSEKRRIALAGADTLSCYMSERVVACALARGDHAGLERLDWPTVMDAMMRNIAPGFDRFPRRHTDVSRALAGDGGWRLTLSSDPRDALPLLEEILSSS